MKAYDLIIVLRFDSSVGRGDFKTKIGVGQVIKGEFATDTHDGMIILTIAVQDGMTEFSMPTVA